MQHTLIHQHRRKRALRKLNPYPHPNPKIRLLDNVVNVVSFVFPLAVLPQIYEIWVNKNVEGVSLLMWLLFLVLTLPLFLYAYVHKDRKLTIMYLLFAIAYIVVLLGLVVVS